MRPVASQYEPAVHCVGTGSDDASCRIFDLRSCGPVAVFTEERIIAGVTDVAFSYTGRLMFASYDESFCRAWETSSKEGCVRSLNERRTSAGGLRRGCAMP